MDKIISGITVNLNEEGYLTDLSQWTKDIALGLAKDEEIELTEKHWEVLNYLQDEYRKETALSIRRIGKSGVVSIKEFYGLFPNGPLKISSKIAGIPKPQSCI